MGGGEVAYRKAAALLPFGAHIYIKALTYCEKLTSLKNTTKGQTQLTLAYGTFEEADLEGCQFVIAATDDRALNRKIAELCKEKNILINTVDDKELCSFYFPSLIKQDEVVVGISSGGNSPVLTQKIRRTVEKPSPLRQYPPRRNEPEPRQFPEPVHRCRAGIPAASQYPRPVPWHSWGPGRALHR